METWKEVRSGKGRYDNTERSPESRRVERSMSGTWGLVLVSLQPLERPHSRRRLVVGTTT